MAKHYPGPWIYLERGCVKTSADLELVSTVYPCECEDVDGQFFWRIGDQDIRRANGRLIAAAPDLLEALKTLLLATRGYLESRSAIDDALLDKIDALIAKATGENHG